MALEKHKKYKESYGRYEIYWGLGIEEETYLQFNKPIYVAAPIFRICNKSERYSVKYFDNYKESYKQALVQLFPDASGCIPIPFFMNSHAFQRMDIPGNHRTTYEKEPKNNPKFTGSSLFDLLKEYNPTIFQDGYDKWFIFDGDTIEFMTQKFYKTSVKLCIKELINYKKLFLEEANKYSIENRVFREKGLLIYPPYNPGFVVHATNPGNISMFNNGTYHINITLPTYLGASGEILYPEKFRSDHQKFIRLIQWLEPFLILEYGTPDPFSKISNRYSNASQRAAVSRYIGIGTYDTEGMPEGKCNTLPITQIPAASSENWWYKRYHTTSGYVGLETLGMDINYKKHFQHGVEIRFFDWFPEKRLEELLEILVCVAEASYKLPLAPPAPFQESWNECVIGVMREGIHYKLEVSERAVYEKHFRVELFKNSVKDIWKEICKELLKYKNGSLAKLFLSKSGVKNCAVGSERK
jgi:hypothetical protein